MKYMTKIITASIFALSLVVAPSAVWAREEMLNGNPPTEVRTATASPSASGSTPIEKDSNNQQRRFEAELRSKLEQKQKERTSSFQQTEGRESEVKKAEKLDEAKKKACEKNINNLNRLKEKMDQRRQNVLERITKVSEAIQAFYTDKQLVVTNYDELVAKVNAAKGLAESAIQSQQQIPSLNCDGDHPRAEVSTYKEKHAAAIDAVKAYRDAVKELALAIKEAAEGAAQESTPSSSPEPITSTEEGVQQ